MRNFIMICAINFCLYFSSYLTMISGTNYAKIALNATTSTAGLVVLLYTLGLILSTLIFGNFIDRLNLKRAIFITMGLDLIVTCLYLVAESIGFLLLLRVATGLLFGVGTLICNTTISKIIPEEKKGVGIGYYNMSVIVASAISPFIAIKLNANLMFKESFFGCNHSFYDRCCSYIFIKFKKC